jgi:putative two-component system response regulator
MHDAIKTLMAGRRRDELADSELATTVGKIAAGVRSHLTAPSPQSHAELDEALAALKFASTRLVTSEIVDSLLDIAQFHYVAGQAMVGLEPAEEAVRIARQIDQPESLRKSLTFLGILKADSGNMPGAIESYGEAVELAIASGNRRAECIVWNNLGVALLYAAQYGDAVACLERAIELSASDQTLRSFAQAANGNIALACLHLEDFGKGLRAAESATASAEAPQSPSECFSRVLNESYYARLLLEVGVVQKAKERCEIAKRFAAQSGLERAHLIAAMAEGLCEVHDKKVDVGLSRLNQVLEKARVAKAPLRDALIAVVKAHQVAGKHDIAYVYLRELMMHTKKVQQDNALLHHRLHLAQLEKKKAARVPDPGALMERQEQSLREKLAKQVAEQELMRSRIEMLERLAVTAELRDDATGEHSYRVGRLASLLAHEYGCDEQTCFMMDLAARLHDVGKIGIPDGVLLKPARLNDTERNIIETHTNVGADLLAKSEVPHMQMAEDIARFHHEWYNGSGYPFGISGTAIPLSARITALADVFDALTHRRPYKEPWPVDQALDEIASAKGTQFDPQLTDLFIGLVLRLQREVGNLDEHLAADARQSPFIRARQKIAAQLKQNQSNRRAD